MASQTTLLEYSYFRWKCPYLACDETFMHARDRRKHLKDVHWKEEQKSSVESAAGSEGSAQPVPTIETAKEAGSSASKESQFAIPTSAHFEFEIPIRTATLSEAKSATEDNSSVNVDTPEESDASSIPREPRCPPQKYTLFDSGDFIAVLGSEEEGEVEVLVSSQALCISSPVWRALCFGSFLESAQKRTTFPDDDPDSMLLLFHIAHMKFNKVPAEMGLFDLHCLAVVCDKYDAAMLLQPWVRNWIEKNKSNSKRYGNEKLLLVFWVFGDAEAFERAAKDLVLLGTCEQGPGTLRMSRSGVTFHETFLVPRIMGMYSHKVCQ
jgi:hypothetical protein